MIDSDGKTFKINTGPVQFRYPDGYIDWTGIFMDNNEALFYKDVIWDLIKRYDWNESIEDRLLHKQANDLYKLLSKADSSSSYYDYTEVQGVEIKS